jgi:uncharacterized repeat protein (TIGR03803 family)
MIMSEPLDAGFVAVPYRKIAVTLIGLVVLAALLTHAAQAQTFTLLHSFTGAGDGTEPLSGLTMDQAGRLYGTTYGSEYGGSSGFGTVYRLTHSGSGRILTTLYTFRGGSDGANPLARVVFGPDGTLYGTTSAGGDGGSGGYGTVFNLRPPAVACRTAQCPWTETVLYRFTGGSDGASPSYGDGPVFDRAGNLYATTLSGGAYGCGVVFKLSRSGNDWTESVLWSFSGGNDGGDPFSGVILDHAGNLYGTTAYGGTEASGVVYELSPSGSGWTQKILYNFTGEDNGPPVGGLIMDADGNLYGTTGAFLGGGEAYELGLVDGSWTMLRRQVFSAYEGPFDAPTLDASGNLYGTSSFSGGDGEVFKLIPSQGGWNYLRLHVFTGGENDGYDPIGGLLLDAGGNVYGTASGGGVDGQGTVFEITP